MAPARKRATTERLYVFPRGSAERPAEPEPALAPRPPRIVPPPVDRPTTFGVRAPVSRVAAPPPRLAAGTVPPPVLERPLPSLFDVVERIRAHKMSLMPGPDDEVETSVVDLDDDEILLSESDLTLVD